MAIALLSAPASFNGNTEFMQSALTPVHYVLPWTASGGSLISLPGTQLTPAATTISTSNGCDNIIGTSSASIITPSKVCSKLPVFTTTPLTTCTITK